MASEPTLLSSLQKNWVWGPDGWGAILLVNCALPNRGQIKDGKITKVFSAEGENLPLATDTLPPSSLGSASSGGFTVDP